MGNIGHRAATGASVLALAALGTIVPAATATAAPAPAAGVSISTGDHGDHRWGHKRGHRDHRSKWGHHKRDRHHKWDRGHGRHRGGCD